MKPLPESSPSPWPFTRLSLKSGLSLSFAYVLTNICQEKFTHGPTPAWAALLIIGAILLLGAVGTYYFCRWLEGLDELQRLIQLKTLALIIPGFLGLAVTGELLLRTGLPGFRWDSLQSVVAISVLYLIIFPLLWWRSR